MRGTIRLRPSRHTHVWQADPSLFLPDPPQGEQNTNCQPLPPQTEQRTSPRPPQLLHFVDPLHTEQYTIAPLEGTDILGASLACAKNSAAAHGKLYPKRGWRNWQTRWP